MEDVFAKSEESLRVGGRLFVVSGPSGVGKGTVIGDMLASDTCPPGLLKCVTATTRPPRKGEIHGRERFFYTNAQFEALIAQDHFLEHVQYNDCYYGTPKAEVEQKRANGNDAILEIEVKGGLTVRALIPEAILIFIAPPSLKALRHRLVLRGSDDEQEIEKRLRIASEEMRAAPHYDYLIINDALCDAVAALRGIILAERSRVVRLPHP